MLLESGQAVQDDALRQNNPNCTSDCRGGPTRKRELTRSPSEKAQGFAGFEKRR
jgi:hypothetical protein